MILVLGTRGPGFFSRNGPTVSWMYNKTCSFPSINRWPNLFPVKNSKDTAFQPKFPTHISNSLRLQIFFSSELPPFKNFIKDGMYGTTPAFCVSSVISENTTRETKPTLHSVIQWTKRLQLLIIIPPPHTHTQNLCLLLYKCLLCILMLRLPCWCLFL